MFFKAPILVYIMKSTVVFFLIGMIPLFFIPSSQGQTLQTTTNDTADQSLLLEEQYFSRGNTLFDSSDYKGAVSSYDKALSINPNDTDVLYQKGRAQNNLGQYDLALTTYDKVLSIDANYSDALKSKGITLDNLGRTDESLASYDQALSISPNDTGTLFLKGSLLEKLGRYDEAMTYFNKTLVVSPTDTDALYQMGQTLEKVGRKNDAIPYYDKALAIDPTNTAVLNSKNLAMGQPVVNQVQGSKMDQGILIAIGVIIAVIIAIIIVDRMRANRQGRRAVDKQVVSDDKRFEKDEPTPTGDVDGWKGI
jgi:tetratricopeptide (TPR) repeat protein